jgi:hypothetical protein
MSGKKRSTQHAEVLSVLPESWTALEMGKGNDRQLAGLVAVDDLIRESCDQCTTGLCVVEYLLKEVASGAHAHIYVIWVGAIKVDTSVDWVFLVNEFMVPKN